MKTREVYRAALVFCTFIFLFCPIYAQGWKSKINPKYRQLLDNVEVLYINNENVDVIWDLDDNPDRADVILLTSKKSNIPTGLVKILRKWLSSGKGIICNPYNVSLFIDVSVNLEGGGLFDFWSPGKYWGEFFYSIPCSDHPITNCIESIANVGTTTGRSSGGWTYLFHRSKSQTYTCVFEAKKHPGSVTGIAAQVGKGRLFSLAFGYDNQSWSNNSELPIFRPEYRYKGNSYIDKADNPRLYLNVMLWLLNREVPE